MNILKTENISQVRARPSIEQDNKADIGRDNKAGMGRDDKAGTGRDNKAGLEKQDNKEAQEDKTITEWVIQDKTRKQV